jgi:methylenetetrahydrofolate reductase (NADPH)
MPDQTTHEPTKKSLTGAAHRLANLNPDFVSVTYGAGGSTKEGTKQVVQRLLEQKLDAVPHLSSGTTSNEEVLDMVQTYKDNGVKQLLCLRGDQPSGQGQQPTYAKDLISLVREQFQDDFNIVVGAYPEIHPDSPSAADEFNFFKQKVEAGANTAITQYFYNAEAYAYFLDGCQKHNIEIPIIPGIMPITNYASLIRFSGKAGADIPRWLDHALRDKQHDEAELSKFGVEIVTRLCERLFELGAPGLHFYTLNRWGASSRICANLGFN